MALAIQHGLLPDPSLVIEPVELKGLGLSSLKSSLSVFEPGQSMPYPDDMEGSKEDKDKSYAFMRQIRLERDGLEAATERWKAEDEKLREMGIHGVLQSKPMQALMWNWFTATTPKIEEEIKRIKEVLAQPCANNMRDDRHVYGPYLEALPPKKLAAAVIATLVQSTASYIDKDDDGSMKVTAVAMKVGADVERFAHEDQKARHAAYIRKMRQKTRRELVTKLRKDNTGVAADVSAPQPRTPHTAFPSYDTLTSTEFPLHIKLKLGAFLLQTVMQSAKITISRENPKTGQKATSTFPAFNSNTMYCQGKRVAHLVPHPEILEKLRTDKVGVVQPLRLPMLVEPKPWVGYDDGAYYTLKEPVVRLKASDIPQKAYAVSAIENNDMNQVLAGLDALGRLPWKINRDVFNVMAATWNSGEGLGGFIPKDPELHCPEELGANASPIERSNYFKVMKNYENKKQAFHSQKAFQNFQLEIARSYLNEPKFYYPHSIDFRGRAYPVPPLLNHMGSDIARGLLLFANGKELGNTGLQWLKIHLANLYGYDKASLRDREQFADKHLEEIYDSATNPLGGNRWWSKADDPWQCLACCVELKNALDSPEPTRYVSHLPIHQDGTCNGLQHYAALGGDRAGASQVNLEPSDKPQDIYTGVAELVKEMVAEDARKGNPHAKFIDGKITRSVVKRTVMTNVYGVTFAGARMQVLDALEDMFPELAGPNEKMNLTPVAVDIAKKIFIALGKIFNGAQEIQCWLGECGDRITSSLSPEQIQKIKANYEGHEIRYDAKYNQSRKITAYAKKNLVKDVATFKNSIIWTTPLKLPVVQPYRKTRITIVKTALTEMSLGGISRSDEVDKRKQLQAFPPNFIHSLDATHMLLSALKCSELGIEFAAVHDSFWTHASDISNMNVVLRDAFVRMHSEDVIGRLLAEFKARYAGCIYLAQMYPDSIVAKEIIRWRTKHRKQHALVSANPLLAGVGEVALEAQRLELLSSDDPEQKQKGKEMVTPTSIWLQHADPTSLYSHRLSLLGETKEKSNDTEVLDRIRESEAQDEDFQKLAESLGAQEVPEESEAMEAAETKEETDEPLDLSEDMVSRSGKPRAKRVSYPVKVWLPLTFPPVPKKGDWDVRRLHQSKYFFS
jgi:DNA-directed RNA polymerase